MTATHADTVVPSHRQDRDYLIAVDLTEVNCGDTRNPRRDEDLGSKRYAGYASLADAQRQLSNDLCDLATANFGLQPGAAGEGQWILRAWTIDLSKGRIMHQVEHTYYVERQEYAAFRDKLNELFARRGFSAY